MAERIDRILNERKRGFGVQYLVRWKDYPQEADTWIAGSKLKGTKALDVWQEQTAYP